MKAKVTNTMVGSFLYNLGISYHEYGVLKCSKTKRKLYDFYKCDSVTSEQHAKIVESIPDAEFKTASPQYAPELKRVLVCIPKAALRGIK